MPEKRVNLLREGTVELTAYFKATGKKSLSDELRLKIV
jgi:hypothetical protein